MKFIYTKEYKICFTVIETTALIYGFCYGIQGFVNVVMFLNIFCAFMMMLTFFFPESIKIKGIEKELKEKPYKFKSTGDAMASFMTISNSIQCLVFAYHEYYFTSIMTIISIVLVALHYDLVNKIKHDLKKEVE